MYQTVRHFLVLFLVIHVCLCRHVRSPAFGGRRASPAAVRGRVPVPRARHFLPRCHCAAHDCRRVRVGRGDRAGSRRPPRHDTVAHQGHGRDGTVSNHARRMRVRAGGRFPALAVLFPFNHGCGILCIWSCIVFMVCLRSVWNGQYGHFVPCFVNLLLYCAVLCRFPTILALRFSPFSDNTFQSTLRLVSFASCRSSL